MQVWDDGRSDYKDFHRRLENAAITFSMINEKGVYKVANKSAIIIPKVLDICEENVEYYIGYKFTEKDTNTVGCFRGQFKITFLDDDCTLIVPVKEDLFINVIDSFVKSDIFC